MPCNWVSPGNWPSDWLLFSRASDTLPGSAIRSAVAAGTADSRVAGVCAPAYSSPENIRAQAQAERRARRIMGVFTDILGEAGVMKSFSTLWGHRAGVRHAA